MNGSSRRAIVVGVDGSEHAARAAEWAAAEAEDRHLPLRLLCAWEDYSFVIGPITPVVYDDYRQAQHTLARHELDTVTNRLVEAHPGLDVSAETTENRPAEALVAASDTAELLVVGTRGRGGFTGLLLGSVSLSVAAHTRCPTIVVRGDSRYDGSRPEVVLAIDSDEPNPPIRFAFTTAARMRASVRVVHAHRPYADYGEYGIRTDDQATTIPLEALIKDTREAFPDITARVEVRHGQLVKELIDAGAGARLMVAGSHRRHGPMSLGVGMTLHGLLHHAPCPVAIVPVA